MSRLVTLFTGQWADLPLEDICRKASDFGYQGLELACWGDHFEINKAMNDSGYAAARRDLLDRFDLQCQAISSHLVGQAVCDRIDARHQAILPPHVWGDGDPAGVNRRAAEARALGIETDEPRIELSKRGLKLQQRAGRPGNLMEQCPSQVFLRQVVEGHPAV